MKNPFPIKKPIYSALVFFGTLGILSAGYAGFVTLQTSDADSGKPLTSGMMQAVIGNLADLDSRVSSMSGAISSLQISAGNLWGTVTGGIGYSGGNVGIGTANPGYKLDVIGNARIYGNSNHTLPISSSYDLRLDTDHANRTMYFAGNGSGYSFQSTEKTSGNTMPLTLNPNGGNVGIGISNPSQRLDLGGGNIAMGYETISDSRTITTNTAYYLICPAGKYLIAWTARTNGWWMEVAHDFETDRMLVLADYNQFPSQLASGVISKIICANIR